MKTLTPILVGSCVLMLVSAQVSLAQQPGRRLISVPQPGNGFGQPQGSKLEASKLLGTNYRILFTGKSGEKSLGELSTLTCSPSVAVQGPLDSSATPVTFGVQGTIEEREGGHLLFVYSISFRVPVATSSSGNVPNGVSVQTNIQFQEHTTSGSLLVKPGQAYEILKAGGATHTVTITPEPDK